eukprot:TRINITY_DN7710_c0_g1_i1.p1 TRINITY_DN7710_c0_g1~~TRINITY_DN7710_c0_g1_i1.p1  ORF type:complete len:135 (+),score=74.41 TRINITY_DN7710_c0_g1_i1:202-606(+)
MAELRGVERLLKAEQEAKQIIQRADEARQAKLKDAKNAALQEIEQIKNEEQRKFEAECKKRFGNTQDEEDLERQTKTEIEKINRDYETNKNKVIDLLIERVMNVELTFPQVLKGKAQQKDLLFTKEEIISITSA